MLELTFVWDVFRLDIYDFGVWLGVKYQVADPPPSPSLYPERVKEASYLVISQQ